MFILLSTIVLYCLPSIIALLREHKDSALIVLVNIMLGWTIIFWIFALILSLVSSQKKEKYIIINNVTSEKE